MMDGAIDINLYHAIGAYALFSMALFGWLAVHKRPLATVARYWGVFTWFCVAHATLIWGLELIPLATDGISYFQNGAHIAVSGFQSDVIANLLKPGLPNLGVNLYKLAEAFLVYLTYPSFALVSLANVFLATMAVFYAARFSALTFGPQAQTYVVFGFVVYFAWYWHVMQNLREAPLLLFLGIALIHYLLWWQRDKFRNLAIASSAAFISALFRPENLLLVVAVAGVTVLYRHRSTLKRFAWSLVMLPPLIYFAIDFGFAVRYSNPIRSINGGRMNRVEAGHYLDLANHSVSSIGEILLQLPETFRYFLVPIWPWDIGAGLIFTKAYVHSLSTFVFVVLAIVGLIRVKQALGPNSHLARPLIVLLMGFSVVAALYSIVDIGAGVASRHSAFFFYFLLASFVPIGLWSLRNVGARIVAPSTRQRRPARLTETEAA